MSSRAPVTGALALALAACTNCPPDYHVIRGMRVLGATFDPPVATPNGAVTVRAVTVDVEDRPVTVAWYRCPAPLVLTPVASADAGVMDGGVPINVTNPDDALAALVAPCLAVGAFAEGVSVRVPVDAAGGARDAFPWRSARRWTDLVGFACAGGSIEPPPAGGVWPRCTGARGVVFTASIPGPRDDGDATSPLPATIGEITLAGRAWDEGTIPVVGRCAGGRDSCAAVPITFRVAAVDVLTEATGLGLNVLGSPDSRLAFVNYHVTDAAPALVDQCVEDGAAVLRTARDRADLAWVPPAATGAVTFWFTARRLTGGLVVVRRSVRVE